MSDNENKNNQVIDFMKMKKARDEAKLEASKAKLDPNSNPALLDKLIEVIDNQDQIMSMIINDLQIHAQKLAQLEALNFNAGLYLENIQTVLREEVGISEDIFREKWNRDIVPRLKELKQAQDKVAKEAKRKAESSIILPNSDIIVPK